jgi:hypothetical protein
MGVDVGVVTIPPGNGVIVAGGWLDSTELDTDEDCDELDDDTICVAVGVAVRVSVFVAVGVRVSVFVGVAVGVGVFVNTLVKVGVAVIVGVGG